MAVGSPGFRRARTGRNGRSAGGKSCPGSQPTVAAITVLVRDG